jgi:hypothetical protein
MLALPRSKLSAGLCKKSRPKKSEGLKVRQSALAECAESGVQGRWDPQSKYKGSTKTMSRRNCGDGDEQGAKFPDEGARSCLYWVCFLP